MYNKLIALDKIVSIYVYVKHIHYRYEYRSELRVLGIRVRKAGVYDVHDLIEFLAKPVKELPHNTIVIDNNVYYKPFCKMYMVDRSSNTRFFETESELEQFVSDITKDRPYILVS